MFKQRQQQVYITRLYRVHSLALHVDILTVSPGGHRIWRRRRHVLLVLIEDCALRSHRGGRRQLNRLLLRLVAVLMRHHHLLLLRRQACTLEAAPLLHLLLLRGKSLRLLALLKMALILWWLSCWGGGQLLGCCGLRVLKSDSRDLSEFGRRKLLLDCLQAWILSLLKQDKELLCTRSHCLLWVLGVSSQKICPRILVSCHFERKIESTRRQIRVRELQHFAMQHW